MYTRKGALCRRIPRPWSPVFGLISAASARDRHRAAKVLVSFNAMESLAGRGLADNRGAGGRGGGGGYARSAAAASERAMYGGADKVGNSSASSRGSLQHAPTRFRNGLSPTLARPYTVCSCFAFSHWPRPHQSNRRTSFEHDTPCPA